MSNYSIARYTKPLAPQPLNEGSYDEAFKNIERVDNPLDQDEATLWSFSTRDTEYVRQQIERAKKAYIIEGTIRNAVDRFADTQSGFRLTGDPGPVNYLEERLNEISLKTGEDWQSLLSRTWLDYWKTGNAMLLKCRSSSDGAVRATYRNTPYAIGSIFLVDITDFDFEMRKDRSETIVTKTWSFRNAKEDFTVTSPDAVKLPIRSPLINDLTMPDNKYLLPGRDLVHLAYKQPPDLPYGIPLTLAAIEVSNMLRRIEQSVVMMIRKSINPLVHHKITGIGPTFSESSIQRAIKEAARKHKNRSPDGVFITGPGHDITSIGAESNALRVSDYMKHFALRLTSTLSSSPFELGFEKGGVNDAEGASALRYSKVYTARAEFARSLEKFLLWELLYEGGFDPYSIPSHKVFLEFQETDQSVITKGQNHYADLYQKDVISLEEARTKLPNIPSATGIDRFHSKLFEKQTDTLPQNSTSRSSNSNQSVEPGPFDLPEAKITRSDLKYIRNLTPERVEDVNSRLDMLSNYFDHDLLGLKSRVKEALSTFKGDYDAIEEAFVNLVSEEFRQ